MDANGTRIVCELNHMRHATSAGSMSTINVDVRRATKRLATSSLSNSPVKSLARESACLMLNDSRTIDYLLIVNVDDGHSALEFLRAN
jgi:hypothetical protein